MIDSKLKEKLLQAGSLEEAKALLGGELDADALEQLLRESAPADGLQAVEDEELDGVSGGLAFREDFGFSVNSWLGALLRNLMKKDSAKFSGQLRETNNRLTEL